MSVSRINRLVMSGVVAFNFGMDYQACVDFYDQHHAKLSELCPSDPRTWDQETISLVNRRAHHEDALVQRMLALPESEFQAELHRLCQETQG